MTKCKQLTPLPFKGLRHRVWQVIHHKRTRCCRQRQLTPAWVIIPQWFTILGILIYCTYFRTQFWQIYQSQIRKIHPHVK